MSGWIERTIEACAPALRKSLQRAMAEAEANRLDRAPTRRGNTISPTAPIRVTDKPATTPAMPPSAPALAKAFIARQDVQVQNAAPYLKIVTAIRAAILSGRLQPGDRISSRAELAAEHNVAPMTVQNALRVLKEDGLIYAEQGRGVFVSAIPEPTNYEYEVVTIEEQVWECNTCGALVRPEKWGRHLAWHIEEQS